MKDTDLLRAELERCDLLQLFGLAKLWLGSAPEQIGHTETAAAFAGALMEHARVRDAVLALRDGLLATRRLPSAVAAELRGGFSASDMKPPALGWRDLRFVQEDAFGRLWLAQRDDLQFRVRGLAQDFSRSALQRLFGFQRALRELKLPGFPAQIELHEEGGHSFLLQGAPKGTSLAERWTRGERPLFSDARPVLRAVLAALAALHSSNLTHGNLRTDNVLVIADDQIVLLDAGLARLYPPSEQRGAGRERHLSLTLSEASAPEQLRGNPESPRTDLYAFGNLAYELLSGQVPFADADLLAGSVRKLSAAPTSLGISADIDAFVSNLLARQPEERPRDAAEALLAFDQLSATPQLAHSTDPAQLTALLTRLKQDHSPAAAEAALRAARNTEAGQLLLEGLQPLLDDASASQPARLALTRLSAQLAAQLPNQQARAEQLYAQLLELTPDDAQLTQELIALKRRLGKLEEVVELLLARVDGAPSAAAKAELLCAIGQIYEDRADPEQAAYAYAQAFAATPENTRIAELIEGLVGARVELWNELLSTLAALAAEPGRDARPQALLQQRLGSWWARSPAHASDAELAFRSALALEPNAHDALSGLQRLLRESGRYRELADLLSRHADLADSGVRARELRTDAAEVLLQQLREPAAARHLFEQVLEQDPHVERAVVGLEQILRAERDFPALRRLLSARLSSVDAERRALAAVALAGLLEQELGDDAAAEQYYAQALSAKPGLADALRGIERIAQRGGKQRALLDALRAQLELELTPREKVAILERVARLEAQEFLEPGRAIATLERLLQIDPHHEAAQSELLQLTARARELAGDDTAAIAAWRSLAERAKNPTERAEHHRRIASASKARGDFGAAFEHYKLALDDDPQDIASASALAELSLERGDVRAAIALWEREVDITPSALQKSRTLLRIARAYKEQLADPERAADAAGRAHSFAPTEAATSLFLADACYDQGQFERAATHYAQALAGGEKQLSEPTLVRYADALERTGKPEEARTLLELALTRGEASHSLLQHAAQLCFSSGAAERAAQLYEELLVRHGANADAGTRADWLTRHAEALLAAGDRERALVLLERALAARPGDVDRRVLTRLMQLYGEAKRWPELVNVVVRLARFVDDPKQRAKYLHTAAIVTKRELSDMERAAELYAEVLTLEPDLDKALLEAIEVERARSNLAGVERLLQKRLTLLSTAEDSAGMLQTFDALGELYQSWPGSRERAVDAYEAAHTLDPENPERAERLRRLYAEDSASYAARAEQLELEQLARDPTRAASYRTLRKLHTEASRADAAYCLCEALCVLGLAEADERRFYERFRPEGIHPVTAPLSNDAWLSHVMHPQADTLLTSVFALIEAAVSARRGQDAQSLGYTSQQRLSVAEHPAPLCQSLYYAAGVLNVPLPPVYADPADPGTLSFVFAHEPSLVLGARGLAPDFPLLDAAFLAARHLASLRPGMYLRQLLASGTALKAWLFAAIQLTSPQFPATPELIGAINEAREALDLGLQGPIRDQLTRVVARLLAAEAPLDLRRWVAAVDFSADRAGLICVQDLQAALDVVRAEAASTTSAPSEERVRELLLYAVNPAYFEVRRALGVAIDV